MAMSDKGKWAEKEAKDWLEAQSKYARFQYHRYPDAKAARGALAAQPADFLVGQRSGIWLPPEPFTHGRVTNLEVKETKELNRLPRDKISQWPKLKLFALAGIRCRALVYRSELKNWVVFDEASLFNYETCPPSFPFAGQPVFADAASALDFIFFDN